MKVIEAHRTRHLVLRLDRGEDVSAAIVSAFEEASANSGWLSGVGTLASAELAVFDAAQRSYAKARRFEPGGDIVSLTGNVSLLDGSLCVRLFVSLARETEAGLQVVAGELMTGRAFAVELHATLFEDASMARVVDERTGQLALVRRSSAASSEAKSGSDSGVPAARKSSPRTGTPTTINEMARAALAGELPQPTPPVRREPAEQDWSEVFPEEGDIATHFLFGECKIISSDGDKIRLQQLKDSRVREVALSALKTELVSEDPETNQRHFQLLRKK